MKSFKIAATAEHKNIRTENIEDNLEMSSNIEWSEQEKSQSRISMSNLKRHENETAGRKRLPRPLSASNIDAGRVKESLLANKEFDIQQWGKHFDRREAFVNAISTEITEVILQKPKEEIFDSKAI